MEACLINPIDLKNKVIPYKEYRYWLSEKRERKGTRENCLYDQKLKWVRVHVAFHRYSQGETTL